VLKVSYETIPVGHLLGPEITAPGYDLRPRLKAFDRPVLVLNGRQDPMDPRMAYETSAAFSRSTLLFVDHGYIFTDKVDFYPSAPKIGGRGCYHRSPRRRPTWPSPQKGDSTHGRATCCASVTRMRAAVVMIAGVLSKPAAPPYADRVTLYIVRPFTDAPQRLLAIRANSLIPFVHSTKGIGEFQHKYRPAIGFPALTLSDRRLFRLGSNDTSVTSAMGTRWPKPLFSARLRP
jgi:hypothetical protein